jgi:hypothetical protein
MDYFWPWNYCLSLALAIEMSIPCVYICPLDRYGVLPPSQINCCFDFLHTKKLSAPTSLKQGMQSCMFYALTGAKKIIFLSVTESFQIL